MIPHFRLSTNDPQADWPWGDNRDNQLPLTVKAFRLHDVADFINNCLCADEIQFDSHARLGGYPGIHLSLPIQSSSYSPVVKFLANTTLEG